VRENVGAPTFKVLLEGFTKEVVFKIIDGFGEGLFHFGKSVTRLTPQKRELCSRTPSVGAPTLKVILEVMLAPRVWGLRL
jgi:hypothetical protein